MPVCEPASPRGRTAAAQAGAIAAGHLIFGSVYAGLVVSFPHCSCLHGAGNARMRGKVRQGSGHRTCCRWMGEGTPPPGGGGGAGSTMMQSRIIASESRITVHSGVSFALSCMSLQRTSIEAALAVTGCRRPAHGDVAGSRADRPVFTIPQYRERRSAERHRTWFRCSWVGGAGALQRRREADACGCR